MLNKYSTFMFCVIVPVICLTCLILDPPVYSTEDNTELSKGPVQTTDISLRDRNLTFNPFGNVFVYRNTPHPSHVVIFVSGDGGWEKGVVDMAESVAGMDALVLGIDFPKYMKNLAVTHEKCLYPAGDFENLSKYAQKKLGIPQYIKPVLAGYSSGATLVYALLVQAPPNSYAGVVSLGFCPDLLLPKPMCHGNGLEWTGPFKEKGYIFSSVKSVDSPWIVLQGHEDKVCDSTETERYVKVVENAEFITLPRVGHGFGVQKNWMPQFKASFGRLFASKTIKDVNSSEISDLPVVEVPSKQQSGRDMAVFLSGDGGWAGFDRDIGDALAEEGIPVAGLNSLSYFWTGRSPESSSKDLARIISHYRDVWHKDSVILVCYSFGADTLPFMVSRLPESLKSVISRIVMISPSHHASFEFHISDWIGNSSTTEYPVADEIDRLKSFSVTCIAGKDETNSLCRDLNRPWVDTVFLPGGHHLGGDIRSVAQIILTGSKRTGNK
jgi:type IV secretory pathway VirJ component